MSLVKSLFFDTVALYRGHIHITFTSVRVDNRKQYVDFLFISLGYCTKLFKLVYLIIVKYKYIVNH